MYPTITEQVEKLKVRQGTGPIVFVGVKSMKIYCHPTCKARPKPENVMIFQSRHEAERLGFRPYKACFSSLPQGICDDHRVFIAIQPPRDLDISFS